MGTNVVRRSSFFGLLNNPLIVQITRFAAIGVLNTTLDFLVFNFLSKHFNVFGGRDVFWVNAISFSCAVVQSYFWNRNWIFKLESESGLLQRIAKLCAIGVLGVGVFGAVLFGAAQGFASFYYLLLLFGFLLLQLVLAHAFGVATGPSAKVAASVQFSAFILVSVIGYAINSGMVVYGLEYLKHVDLGVSQDLLKNIAKILATLVSLVWNFLGYKLIVFKRK